MPRRLLLALLIMVAGPLVLLGWLSASAMREQQVQAQNDLLAILESRLDEFNRNTRELFANYKRNIEQSVSASKLGPFETLKDLERSNPVVRQCIFMSSDSQMLYPQPPLTDDPESDSVYKALATLVGNRPALGYSPDNSLVLPNAPATQKQRSRAASVWQVWYMDEGAQLVLWIDYDGSRQLGVLLERTRWMSELTAKLPDGNFTTDGDGPRAGSTAMIDEAQRVVYRWGSLAVEIDKPMASVSLDPPLSSWQFQYHSAPIVMAPSVLPLIASLGGIGVVFLALGGYVLTSVRRHMRAAKSRVSFAGQVSHELRTPLTNIRLYAELAEKDLGKLEPGAATDALRSRLDVIDSESRRLGRLVSGVLELTRNDVQQRAPQLTECVPDQLITSTVEQFSPSLQQAGIEAILELDAGEAIKMDGDIFEMVLVNLLSNVEKYAAQGKHVTISSTINATDLIVKVTDRGPGIPARSQRTVFRPFTRLDNSISAPSGTGIGLTIAKRAAERHRGELNLIPVDVGACFELKIPVEK